MSHDKVMGKSDATGQWCPCGKRADYICPECGCLCCGEDPCANDPSHSVVDIGSDEGMEALEMWHPEHYIAETDDVRQAHRLRIIYESKRTGNPVTVTGDIDEFTRMDSGYSVRIEDDNQPGRTVMARVGLHKRDVVSMGEQGNLTTLGQVIQIRVI